MKLNALIEKLAKKANVDTTLLALPAAVNDVDVPDEIANSLDKALMTIEAAKNNPEVRKAARAEALNGVDSKIIELLEEHGIEDADDITTEKNSFAKIGLLTKKVQALEAAKAKTSKAPEKDALEAKIADLNKQLKVATEGLTNKEKEWQTTRDGDLTNFEIQKILLGKDYSLPKEMDRDLVVTTAQSAVNKALGAKGFKIVRTEQGQLTIVDKDGNKAYSDSHEEIQLPSFIDGALAQNKLLRINDPANPGNNGPVPPIIPSNGQGKGNEQAIAAIDQQMKELFTA